MLTSGRSAGSGAREMSFGLERMRHRRRDPSRAPVDLRNRQDVAGDRGSGGSGALVKAGDSLRLVLVDVKHR